MTSNKKIAILASFPAWIVAPTLQSPGGHYAVWLVSLYEALSTEASRYEIHWIVMEKYIRKAQLIESNHQFFHLLPAYSLTLAQRTHYLRERFLIARELKRIKPDLVHAWGTERFYALAGKWFKGNKILSMQGLLTAYCQRSEMPAFQVRQSKLEPSTMRAYSHITSESQWGIERCRELAPQATTHLWDYSANKLFYDGTRHLSSSPTCLMAGTNTPVKNVTCAIEAFSRPELSHITLYLAGIAEGEYEKLPHNIIPLGRLNREAIKEKLSTVWCLVHPSLADTCPNIVKEARVMGVPCVVTTECGAKQYVVHEKSGYVIPVKNSDALAKAVLKMTESADTSLRMGAYDRERCREALSADTMIRKLFELYEQVLAE